MSFLLFLFICSGVATVIAAIFKAIDGDDGKPWPHPGPGDTHHWK